MSGELIGQEMKLVEAGVKIDKIKIGKYNREIELESGYCDSVENLLKIFKASSSFEEVDKEELVKGDIVAFAWYNSKGKRTGQHITIFSHYGDNKDNLFVYGEPGRSGFAQLQNYVLGDTRKILRTYRYVGDLGEVLSGESFVEDKREDNKIEKQEEVFEGYEITTFPEAQKVISNYYYDNHLGIDDLLPKDDFYFKIIMDSLVKANLLSKKEANFISKDKDVSFRYLISYLNFKKENPNLIEFKKAVKKRTSLSLDYSSNIFSKEFWTGEPTTKMNYCYSTIDKVIIDYAYLSNFINEFNFKKFKTCEKEYDLIYLQKLYAGGSLNFVEKLSQTSPKMDFSEARKNITEFVNKNKKYSLISILPQDDESFNELRDVFLKKGILIEEEIKFIQDEKKSFEYLLSYLSIKEDFSKKGYDLNGFKKLVEFRTKGSKQKTYWTQTSTGGNYCDGKYNEAIIDIAYLSCFLGEGQYNEFKECKKKDNLLHLQSLI